MANYMAEVAKLLGVELGESFKTTSSIQGNYHRYYQFTDKKGFETSVDGVEWETAAAVTLRDILMGDIRIVKLPWKPQKGEKYYIPCIGAQPEYMYSVNHWDNDDIDKKYYHMGIVCKTKEEAIALTEKMLVAINEQ